MYPGHELRGQRGQQSLDPVRQGVRWFKQRSMPEKIGLGAAGALLTLGFLYYIIEDHDTLFILSEACHLAGLGILIYKLQQKQSAAGLSLRTQVLTAVFLGVRLICSFIMEYDIHTILDLMTLAATCWVITMILTKLKSSWQQDKDVLLEAYILIPCALLALISHPRTRHAWINRVFWAFCVYVEAVSVAPQVIMMQRNRTVERFTGHYVFFLGMARFFSCAHWLLQMVDERNAQLWAAIGSGLWPVMVLVSEVVQTFILADFCYYYIKSYASGIDLVQLPAGIV